MRIVVNRRKSTAVSTPSVWTIDGSYFCVGLEDVVRKPGVYVRGATAIPAGEYQVVWAYSPRFNIYTPRLLDLPGRRTMFGLNPLSECGILIHVGNFHYDTDGCLLVGTKITGSTISQSQVVTTKLYKLIREATQRKELVTILIQ
jgi:hypothetical protein